jgi:hypothetical protein
LNARRVVPACSPFTARRFRAIGPGSGRTGSRFRRPLARLPDFRAGIGTAGLSSFGGGRSTFFLIEPGGFTVGTGGRGILAGRASFESLAESFGNPQFLFDRLPQLLRAASVLFLRDAGFAEIPQFLRLMDELLPASRIQPFKAERSLARRLDQRSQ